MPEAARSAARWKAAPAAVALLLAGGPAAEARPPSSMAAPPLAAPAAPAAAEAPGARPRPAPAPGRTAAVADLPQPLALEGLRGGGDAAPLCRARCAPAFYGCASGGAETGACHLALAACRRGCDAAEPAPGRLQSPLPAAGLAPAAALRPLPGSLPPLR